jgi:hypothetical protein
MHDCSSLHTHIHTYTLLVNLTYIHTYVSSHTYIHTYLANQRIQTMRGHLHTYIYAYIHTCIHTVCWATRGFRRCGRMRIYLHTYIHPYMHTVYWPTSGFGRGHMQQLDGGQRQLVPSGKPLYGALRETKVRVCVGVLTHVCIVCVCVFIHVCMHACMYVRTLMVGWQRATYLQRKSHITASLVHANHAHTYIHTYAHICRSKPYNLGHGKQFWAKTSTYAKAFMHDSEAGALHALSSGGMGVCVSVCMCEYVTLYTYGCVCVSMHELSSECMCICLYVGIYVILYTHVCMHVLLSVCMCAHICAKIFFYTRTNIQAYIHTYTHT